MCVTHQTLPLSCLVQHLGGHLGGNLVSSNPVPLLFFLVSSMYSLLFLSHLIWSLLVLFSLVSFILISFVTFFLFFSSRLFSPTSHFSPSIPPTPNLSTSLVVLFTITPSDSYFLFSSPSRGSVKAPCLHQSYSASVPLLQITDSVI